MSHSCGRAVSPARVSFRLILSGFHRLKARQLAVEWVSFLTMNGDGAMVGWVTALLLFGGLAAATEVGFRLCKRYSHHAAVAEQLGSIQGAILGLLSLLLGFSFAAASARYSDRIQLILEEANAIRTVWVRVDLVPPEQRAPMRDALKAYVAARIQFYEVQDSAGYSEAIFRAEELQGRLWRTAAPAVLASPILSDALMIPIDDLTRIHARRLTAAEGHLPGLILLILLLCSVVALGCVGYGRGIAGNRLGVLTTALAFLVAAVLWAIIDLDHPRSGLIRAGQRPLVELQQCFEKSSHPLFRKE